MKKQKMEKRFTLKKKTVSNLNSREMGKAKGGLRCTIRCWLYETHEFMTCDCTYYCSEPAAGCPSAS